MVVTTTEESTTTTSKTVVSEQKKEKAEPGASSDPAVGSKPFARPLFHLSRAGGRALRRRKRAELEGRVRKPRHLAGRLLKRSQTIKKRRQVLVKEFRRRKRELAKLEKKKKKARETAERVLDSKQTGIHRGSPGHDNFGRFAGQYPLPSFPPPEDEALWNSNQLTPKTRKQVLTALKREEDFLLRPNANKPHLNDVILGGGRLAMYLHGDNMLGEHNGGSVSTQSGNVGFEAGIREFMDEIDVERDVVLPDMQATLALGNTFLDKHPKKHPNQDPVPTDSAEFLASNDANGFHATSCQHLVQDLYRSDEWRADPGHDNEAEREGFMPEWERRPEVEEGDWKKGETGTGTFTT